MLFSDIKDFTQFTDASDPEDVAKLLNEYLGEMAIIVRKWGGTIEVKGFHYPIQTYRVLQGDVDGKLDS